MRRDAQALVLLLIGGALTRICLSGTAARYVRPDFVVWVLLAGLALIGLAGVTLYQVARGHYVEESVPAGKDPGEARLSWLLVAGTLALILLSPPAVGADLAARSPSAVSTVDSSALPAGDPVALSLSDFNARALADSGKSLTGRRLRLTGFVVSDAHQQPFLGRIVLGCCVADARTVKVGLDGDIPGLWPGGWIEVTGTFADHIGRDPVGGGPVAFLQVDGVRAVAPPTNPYEG